MDPKHITTDAEFDLQAGQSQMLFEAEGYTLVSAVLRNDSRKRLAQKCDGPVETIRGCPTGWHIVPEFLEVPLLHALLTELHKNPNRQTITVADRRKLVHDELDYFLSQMKQTARA
jgi:hypothetical protein